MEAPLAAATYHSHLVEAPLAAVTHYAHLAEPLLNATAYYGHLTTPPTAVADLGFLAKTSPYCPEKC